jgi:hypothetical protein
MTPEFLYTENLRRVAKRIAGWQAAGEFDRAIEDGMSTADAFALASEGQDVEGLSDDDILM